MTEAQQDLVAAQVPITLTTAEVQSIWSTGKRVREWADKNSMKLTVTKGFVTIEASGKPISTSSVADEVAKVAQRVRRVL